MKTRMLMTVISTFLFGVSLLSCDGGGGDGDVQDDSQSDTRTNDVTSDVPSSFDILAICDNSANGTCYNIIDTPTNRTMLDTFEEQCSGGMFSTGGACSRADALGFCLTPSFEYVYYNHTYTTAQLASIIEGCTNVGGTWQDG